MSASDPARSGAASGEEHHAEMHTPAAEVGADEITPAPEAEHAPAHGEGEGEPPHGHRWWQDDEG